MCGHKDPFVPLDAKPFGFPFDRNIDFDIHDKNKNTLRWDFLSYCWSKSHFSHLRSVSNSMVRIIFLASIMEDEMIGSEIFTKSTTATKTSTSTTPKPTPDKNGGNDDVCKTKVQVDQVTIPKNGGMYKTWWCTKANGEMRIVKYQKVVTRWGWGKDFLKTIQWKTCKIVFYRTQVYLGSNLWGRLWMSLTPSDRSWWTTLQTIQVATPDDQILNQFKYH